MTTALLNECGDIHIANGGFILVSAADEIRQRWLIRVRTFLGEWFLDENIGVPYFQFPGTTPLTIEPVTSKALTRRTLKAVFTRVTLQTPGVLTVESVIVNSLDAANRTAEITVTAKIDAPEDSAVFEYSGSFPPDGCGPAGSQELPLTIQSGELVVWFDGSDVDSIDFVDETGIHTSQQNKAGPGILESGAQSFTLWSPTAFGNRGGFELQGAEFFTISDTPAIRFNSDPNENPMTYFVVFHPAAMVTQGVVSWSGTDGATDEFQEYRLTVLAHVLTSQTAGNPLANEFIGSPAAVAQRTTVKVSYDSGGDRMVSTFESVAEGVVVRNDAVGTQPPLLDGAGLLGARPGGAAPFTGFIGELLAYRGVLSDADTAAVHAWLDQKWGL